MTRVEGEMLPVCVICNKRAQFDLLGLIGGAKCSCGGRLRMKVVGKEARDEENKNA